MRPRQIEQHCESIYNSSRFFSMDSSIMADNLTFQAISELLIATVEHRFPGTSCSFHHKDDSCFFLETCIAPNLPNAYGQDINISTIKDEDAFWSKWREYALQHGLVLCWSKPILSSEEAAIGLISVFANASQTFSEADLHFLNVITQLAGMVIEKKLLDTKIHRLAFYDKITGLSNRQHFQFELQRVIQQNNNNQTPIGVLFIGIDRFKTINDTFGHAVGDLFLLKAGQRLQSCLESNALLARMDGDEFAVLVSELKNENQLINIAEQILESWKQPININGFETKVTVSIGGSLFRDTGGGDATALMKNADIALHKAKENGRNQIQLFA